MSSLLLGDNLGPSVYRVLALYERHKGDFMLHFLIFFAKEKEKCKTLCTRNPTLNPQNPSAMISLCPAATPPPPTPSLAATGPVLSLHGTPLHYHAFISSPAGCHGRLPLGPPGYFTNNLFLISHRAPLPVIKEPINGAGKGEAFK